MLRLPKILSQVQLFVKFRTKTSANYVPSRPALKLFQKSLYCKRNPYLYNPYPFRGFYISSKTHWDGPLMTGTS